MLPLPVHERIYVINCRTHHSGCSKLHWSPVFIIELSSRSLPSCTTFSTASVHHTSAT